MRRVASLALAALTLAACGTGSIGDGSTSTSLAPTTTTLAPTTTEVTDEGNSPAIYAAALHELVTVDHTFGSGPAPFTVFLIQDHLDSRAGDLTGQEGETRPLTEEEKEAIEAAIGDLGEVAWIDDPDEWRDENGNMEVTEDEYPVILGVGEIEYDDEGALAPVSMFCGSLCGTWFTYRLAEQADVWDVTGIEGPIAIS